MGMGPPLMSAHVRSLSRGHSFFQAEDGIRDKLVTGVQTCALPIWWRSSGSSVADHTAPGPGRRIPFNRAPARDDQPGKPLPHRRDRRDRSSQELSALRMDCRHDDRTTVEATMPGPVPTLMVVGIIGVSPCATSIATSVLSWRPVNETDRCYPVFVYGTLRPGQPNWGRLLAAAAERVVAG